MKAWRRVRQAGLRGAAGSDASHQSFTPKFQHKSGRPTYAAYRYPVQTLRVVVRIHCVSSNMRSLSRCAAALAQCRVARTAVCEAITGDAAPKTVADAYEVQRELHSLLSSPIISVVGQKIGCTTAVMQEYLHIPHPCAGGIYDNALWRTTQWRAERSIPHSINRSQWHHVGLECEIAVQLKMRLGPGAVSREEAASAIGSVHAAVEIVDDRYEDFRACKPPPLTWIADDFFHGGSVLGLPLKVDNAPLDPMLLDRLVGVMSVDGRAVGAGSGADIINGHPLEALR